MNPWQTRSEHEVDPVTKVCLIVVYGSLAVILAMLFAGCTSLTIEQRDESPDQRTITTTVKATAWFSSAQTIAKLKATTTDRTQSFGTDSIGQQGATNSVAALQAIARILEALRPAP
jgi:hypothetical protein